MTIKMMEKNGQVVGWEVEITQLVRKQIQRWLDEKPGRTPEMLQVSLAPDRSFVQISCAEFKTSSDPRRMHPMPELPDMTFLDK